jgi:hypothetical protein
VKKILFILMLISLLGAGCALTPPAVVSFTVNPSAINAGQLATLTWTVNNASTVKIDPFSGNQYSSGSTVVSPPATTTYVLIASNMGGNATSTVTLTVNPIATQNPVATINPALPPAPPPAVTDFRVTPSSINMGDSAILKWDTTGATSVFIEPDIGYVSLSGSQAVSPTNSTSYVLTASNASSTVTSSATLNINPYPPYGSSYPLQYPSSLPGSLPQVNFFDINPPIINPGSSTTMQWDVSGADSIFINQGIGDVQPLGTMTVSPPFTTSYTITAANYYGSVTSLATAIVNPAAGAPVIVSFKATPNSITAGNSSILQWSITGAASVSIDQGIGAVASAGTQSVSPTVTTTYTVTATNSSGSAVATTRVVVSPANGLPVIISFISNPTGITTGHSSILQWDVSGATSISINQGIGAVPPSGTHLVSPAATTAYTLTATNSSGSITASATVTLTQPGALPVILRFSLYPTSVTPGGSSTLQWQVGGATTSVSIDQGIGEVPPSGELQVSPAATRTYTLTATNSSGPVIASVTVTVISQTGQPFIDYFAASPTVIKLGDMATLQWQVTGATSISITGLGTVSASGTRVIAPEETTVYVLAARNSAGVVTHTAQVTVTFER